MSLTPAQLRLAFFNVLYSDSAGAATRAALGDGVSSVILREALTQPYPATPFLVLHWNSQPSGGPRNRGVKTYYPTWFLYDMVSYRQSRLDPIQTLIEAAYPEDGLSMCYVDFLPVRDLSESALGGMPAKSMPFQVRTRG
jgi:hypothetical protein